MKKILALLLALATLFAVVGCATQTPEVNDSSEKAATEDPTTVGTNQPTEKPTESTTEPTTETPDDPKDPMPEPLDKSKQYRILFINACSTLYDQRKAQAYSLGYTYCLINRNLSGIHNRYNNACFTKTD